MQLTKAFEQSVCVMAMLTTQTKDIPLGSYSIHKHLGASATYIQKIVRKLVVSNLVLSVSGQRGGFMLARPAEEISYLDVIEAIEGPVDTFPNTSLIGKVLGNVTDDDKISKAEVGLHRAFKEADEKWRASLSGVTIQDLVNESLDGQTFKTTNWNEYAPKNELLVKRLLKGGDKS